MLRFENHFGKRNRHVLNSDKQILCLCVCVIEKQVMGTQSNPSNNFPLRSHGSDRCDRDIVCSCALVSVGVKKRKKEKISLYKCFHQCNTGKTFVFIHLTSHNNLCHFYIVFAFSGNKIWSSSLIKFKLIKKWNELLQVSIFNIFINISIIINIIFNILVKLKNKSMIKTYRYFVTLFWIYQSKALPPHVDQPPL